MHILIIGAAGMVGRKLTGRLVAEGALAGRNVSALTLVDVIARAAALGFKAEASMDEIVRAHVEDELGGKIRG
jgi:D-erythronate 2-dehydrogenase